MLTNSEHQKLHAANRSEEYMGRLRKSLIENAVPKAAEWHRSDEGREWHRKHGRESWKNRKPYTYKCTRCGGMFDSLKAYSEKGNRFCSNKCKSAYRRKMGLDNEQRNCELCGSEFTANKYSHAKRCSKCRHIKHKESGK